ncbi:MAG: PPC domain-containing protein [Gammaproteobacteria bacterium]|nr:PPC domain-containing protein [Gammaproteobacteria bacterium]
MKFTIVNSRATYEFLWLLSFSLISQSVYATDWNLSLSPGQLVSHNPTAISQASAASATTHVTHTIPYFPSASDRLGRQGFARIVNRSDRAGTVSIAAYDDGGNSFGPVTLSLDALQTVHFNSVELEDGEASKGLPEGTGAPSRGDWWLELSSELDINVLSYIRTPGGFVTSMHDVVPRDTNTYHVAFFNPGSNTAQESLLRLVNPGDDDVSVTIRGIDDQGDEAPGGAVSLTLPSRASRTVTAMDLEVGAADLEGSLGDGAGKWRFALAADRTIMAISMLSTPTGHLTNLSTDPGLGGEPASVERLPAPVIEVTGTREFAFSWTWSAQAGETYAFDYGPRFNGGEWVEECAAVSYSETLEDTIRVTYTTTQDLVAGTVIEARYRYRNSSSCESGSPGSWSHIGSTTVADDIESDDHSDTRSGATSLSLGGSQSGRIDPGTDVDYFEVQVNEPGTLTVYSTGTIDAEGELQDSSGSVLDSNSDSGDRLNFRIEHSVSAGVYYVKVESWRSGVGDYSVHASLEVNGGGGGEDSYCRDGDTIQPGNRCDIFNTSTYFQVTSAGRGCLGAGICAGNRLVISSGGASIDASRNDDNSWTIVDVEPEPSD